MYVAKSRFYPLVLGVFACSCVFPLGSAWVQANPTGEIDYLISQGKFAEAEKLLERQIADRSAPVVEGPAVKLETLRRTRLDFSLDAAALLAELKEEMPDATMQDVARWTETEILQHLVIDGKVRYFRRAVGNLFRFSEEAKKRRKSEQSADAADDFSLPANLAEVVKLAESTGEREIFPLKHTVTYTLEVKSGHPRVKPGAKVRAWLPFPQEYRQQRDVQLLESEPAATHIASTSAPQRTIYFEQQVRKAAEPVKFMAKYQFVTSAYYPQLDPAAVEPYDTASDLYRKYTAERSPHIVFTQRVRRLVPEIVGKETNPLKKAELVFRWVSKHLPWCAEMEYSIIPNLSDKGLNAGQGDCGVQGMSFITLCRAAGVPARWQSGWQLKPGHWNMHDWSEFYVEPWGWLPADASWGLQEHEDPRVQMYFCGHLDPYRMIVNLDYARELEPPKTSFRSEPNDFQRGEVEIDGHNLYFDEWDYEFKVETEPVDKKKPGHLSELK